MQPCTLFWWKVKLPEWLKAKDQSTFQAIRLLESRKMNIIISIVGGNWEERLGADEHSIMGEKIGITCMSLAMHLCTPFG